MVGSGIRVVVDFVLCIVRVCVGLLFVDLYLGLCSAFFSLCLAGCYNLVYDVNLTLNVIMIRSIVLVVLLRDYLMIVLYFCGCNNMFDILYKFGLQTLSDWLVLVSVFFGGLLRLLYILHVIFLRFYVVLHVLLCRLKLVFAIYVGCLVLSCPFRYVLHSSSEMLWPCWLLRIGLVRAYVILNYLSHGSACSIVFVRLTFTLVPVLLHVNYFNIMDVVIVYYSLGEFVCLLTGYCGDIVGFDGALGYLDCLLCFARYGWGFANHGDFELFNLQMCLNFDLTCTADVAYLCSLFKWLHGWIWFDCGSCVIVRLVWTYCCVPPIRMRLGGFSALCGLWLMVCILAMIMTCFRTFGFRCNVHFLVVSWRFVFVWLVVLGLLFAFVGWMLLCWCFTFDIASFRLWAPLCYDDLLFGQLRVDCFGVAAETSWMIMMFYDWASASIVFSDFSMQALDLICLYVFYILYCLLQLLAGLQIMFHYKRFSFSFMCDGTVFGGFTWLVGRLSQVVYGIRGINGWCFKCFGVMAADVIWCVYFELGLYLWVCGTPGSRGYSLLLIGSGGYCGSGCFGLSQVVVYFWAWVQADLFTCKKPPAAGAVVGLGVEGVYCGFWFGYLVCCAAHLEALKVLVSYCSVCMFTLQVICFVTSAIVGAWFEGYFAFVVCWDGHCRFMLALWFSGCFAGCGRVLVLVPCSLAGQGGLSLIGFMGHQAATDAGTSGFDVAWVSWVVLAVVYASFLYLFGDYVACGWLFVVGVVGSVVILLELFRFEACFWDFGCVRSWYTDLVQLSEVAILDAFLGMLVVGGVLEFVVDYDLRFDIIVYVIDFGFGSMGILLTWF
eukprot:gene3002-1984_t